MSEVQIVEVLDGAVTLETIEEVIVIETGEEVNTRINVRDAREARDAARTSELAALASEEAAKLSELASLASEVAAKASEVDAQSSEDEAEQWARSLVPVEGNYYGSLKYALDSQASAVAADVSETNALLSEQAAKASETASGLSEAAALVSENAAKVSETNSAASEAASMASQVASKASEDAAALSEAASAASEGAANLSAVAAQGSEDEAQQWAVSLTEVEPGLYGARKYRDDSVTSAAAALTSEGNATASEVASAASESAAAVSETNAQASEIASAASESAAALSESNAAASETNASSSESWAEQWAENPYNIVVVTGKYSSLHYATVADSHRAAALQSAVDASNARTGAETAETNAKASETATAASENAAWTSETNASASELAAAASETAAASSENLSYLWAQKAEDQEVTADEYSAYHWAKKAQQLVTGTLVYLGSWDASTGAYPTNPFLGNFWKVSVAGTVGAEEYKVGDSIIYNGTGWDHIDNTESVTSVGGNIGAVTDTQLRDAVKRVDGSGSGLDADTLDGLEAAAFASLNHNHSADEIITGVLDKAQIPTIDHGDTSFANQYLNTGSSVQHAKVRAGGTTDDGTNSLQVDGGTRTDTLAAGSVQAAQESIDTDGNVQVRGEGQLKMGDFAIQYNAATQSLDFNWIGG